MNKVANLLIKLVVGVVVIMFLVETLSPGGALGNLTGMLIAKYPFHKPILEAFQGTMGWDISFVPAVESSVLDDSLILAIAAVISGGIASVLKHIFNPVDMREYGAKEYMQSAGYRMRGMAVSVLSSVVTILFSNMIFSSVLQKVNASFLGGIVFTVIKVAVLLIVIALFVVFVRAAADLGSGKGAGPGLLAVFAIGSVVRTVAVDVCSVCALAAMVNNAGVVAGPLFVVYAVIVLATSVGGRS